MAPLTQDQLRRRQQLEGLIRLIAPALDVVLAVGECVWRLADRGDREHYALELPREERPPAGAAEGTVS